MKLRTLEEKDLPFVHELNNEHSIMTYWFREPYESLTKLKHLYNKHFLDASERRFVVEDGEQLVGIVELVGIDHIHRNCEIQIIIKPEFGGKGYAKYAFKETIDYAFNTLNMYKVFLYVDTTNEKAVHIYTKQGFVMEGTLKEHFYTNGAYKDAYIMSIFKKDWLGDKE
ncbi:GNAT family N-acetyltransferase [Gracilibacillus alcaliphilus]|uniref:GNAT family N-acetyltransferase n=1 Tax=Gracilibacillus alcaliphilus TaxID=1401441 RepID=UPI001956E10D|nr:GNAT family N-acetyltransferase [Gracilibacillus alcaliphilus]MBM7676049.1 diamine N-acetyltransferase [Gracilibacillus alcaliphilus]